MNTFPQSLDEAVNQAKEATLAALADGYNRVQVELVIAEIPLQAQALALEFTTIFTEYGSGLKVLFPDTGAASLAKRDWGEVAFRVTDLGSRYTPVETKVAPEDELFLLVCPSSVEVERVEKLCNAAGDRPVVLLIPQLEDVSIVGIGLAARQLRERFISTLFSAYYFQPLEGAALLRCHPSPWQIWLEKEEGYELASEQAQKPVGDALERLLLKLTSGDNTEDSNIPRPKKSGILSNLQKMIRALNQ
ncbi:MAG: DUF1995 family protein [Xenococcaceae cyanobacterium MO_188.B29]|nr:DUF1995 family protein [Xenococcaceae cyanobacterium MO_188.B29]